MNKIFLFYIIASTLCFFSCNFKQADHTQDIKNTVSAVEKIVSIYDNNVQSAIENNHLSYIKEVSLIAMDDSNIKLEELKNLRVASEHEALLAASIAYVSALQDVIATEEAYSDITDSSSMAAAKEVDKNFLSSLENAKNRRAEYDKILNTLSIDK